MDNSKPNILYIMTDQQRFDVMSRYGGAAKTPNLDALAAESADCRMGFAQTPVCVPSRCTIFSGRYPHNHGAMENDSRLAPYEPHLFKVCKEAGYHLGYVEKNHLLEERELRNFDFLDVEGRGNHRRVPRHLQAVRKEYEQFVRAAGQRLGTVASWASATFHDFPEEVTDAYVTRQSAIEFIEHAPAGKPFCLCLSFHDPHVPHVAPRRFEKMYPLDQIRVPENLPGVLEQKAARFKIKQQAQGSLKATDHDRRHYLAVYYSMISWVDENIGAILKVLEERGLRENTIIVFTSDHGDFNFQYNMCKKDLVLLDCLLHVPMIVSWRGRIRPQVVDGTFVEHADIYSTLLELAGIERPYGVQGKSLMPLLDGRADRHRDFTCAEICPADFRNPYKTHDEFIADWEKNNNTKGHLLCWTANYNVPGDFVKSIRTKQYRYTWYGDGFEELYDHQKDPRELCNLARDPANAGLCRELKLQLFEWYVKTEDTLSPRRQRESLQRFASWIV